MQELSKLRARWRRTPVVVRFLAIAGLVTLALGYGISLGFESSRSRFWHAYLLNVCFVLSIGLGGLFFVILQHLTNAKWSVVVRRIAELTTLLIPLCGILLIPVLVSILLGNSQLYDWNDAEHVAHDPVLQAKAAYLNAPFFVIRSLLYLAIWVGLGHFFRTLSEAQDQAEDLEAWHRLRRASGPAMIVYAVTVNFAAFDWLMSLDAHWFSSIYGVYFFSGCAVAFFAFLPLVTAYCQRRGRLHDEITQEHYHDMGKLLYGFNFFWAYIAFSQYLLIWYANITEETIWFARRQQGGWQWVALVLIGGHFALPLFGLMSRKARRSLPSLLTWSTILLCMHWVDLFWLTMPQTSEILRMPALVDGCGLVGVVSLAVAWMLHACRGRRLVPIGDPYLSESLAFHNV